MFIAVLPRRPSLLFSVVKTVLITAIALGPVIAAYAA